MNDPNKVISVNLSSLLSLKAELLRKQAEVSKAKATRVGVDDFTPKQFSSTKKQKEHDLSENRITEDQGVRVQEYEDTALLEKSQKTLVAKSKFYERMRRTGGKLNSDDNCLVLFNRKKQEDELSEESLDKSANNSSANSSSGSEAEDDDDWVEYMDCLGRTRKCLRKDLESAKKRDRNLANSMPERLDQSKPNWMIDVNPSIDDTEKPIGPEPTESIYSDGVSMMSKHDEMRANWEKKNEENVLKPNVHYQDVFFDEARQHGVGYYAFSTDETERAKQQRELEETRKETTIEQEQRDKLRAEREKIIAERVKAAKNRQRARLGLPPLEEEAAVAEETEKSDTQEESKVERRERKRLAKQKRKEDKLAAKQELERKHHVRPWDKEKDGVATCSVKQTVDEPEWSYKPERLPMSQEEWNEHKRTERNPQFAPLSSSSSTAPKHLRTSFTSNLHAPIPPTDFASFQSSKPTQQFQRRNYQNDISHNEEKPVSYSRGAAIPPPADLDAYHLPSQAKKSKSNVELERSIEAGLRFLRDNSDKDTMSMKSSWTSRADY